SDEGIRNGNSAKPTVRMTPVIAVDVARNADTRAPRHSSSAASSDPATPSTGASHIHGQREKLCIHAPSTASTVFSAGLLAAAPSTVPVTPCPASPSASQSPPHANSAPVASAGQPPNLRARIAMSPSVRQASNAPPCAARIVTLNTPASSANGMNSWNRLPSYTGRSVAGSTPNGRPSSRLPIATPNTRLATTPEPHSSQSQVLRQRASGSLLRYLKPTGRRISATSRSSIARYRPENEAAYSSGHAAKIAPPPVISQTWLPSHTGPTRLSITLRSSSVLATTGNSAATPRSKPSMTANPISSTPSSSHQITRNVAYSSGIIETSIVASCQCAVSMAGSACTPGASADAPDGSSGPLRIALSSNRKPTIASVVYSTKNTSRLITRSSTDNPDTA